MKRGSLIIALLFTLLLCQQNAEAQAVRIASGTTDSIGFRANAYTLRYQRLIVPAVLIGYGVIGLKNEGLKELNRSTRDEILEDRPGRTTWDNYTQYAPALMVYGFNAAGLEGWHRFKERTLIYATSQLISTAFVVPLKRFTHVERPDGSNFESFPSGHTATAFSSAHFLFREYKDSNIWLSLSGYPLAIFTGVYRTINNKHWVSDVVAGAGFGILSTEMAYWLYPKMRNLVAKRPDKTATVWMPTYQNGMGIALTHHF